MRIKKQPEAPEILGPDFIKQPIEYIRSCAYKGTAFKVELEGQLFRRDGSIECLKCSGRGFRFCRDCTDGFIDGARRLKCKTCKALARILCDECAQLGRKKIKTMGETECSDFILGNVSKEAREALIFKKFYNDGSVDSEFTFTLPIEKAVYAVEFVKAFKKLSEHIGAGVDVNGAGMHLAILNSKDGNYPGGNILNTKRVANFKSAMTHFMPTLYFLGSATFKSRGLNYRRPQIGHGKDCAINYFHGVFEYRFFETCYTRPEAILEDLCVIAKTLEYYSDKSIKHTWFDKVGTIGIRDGLGVHRFFFTKEHLDALEYGLKHLKPDHKTTARLKRDRNFTITYDKLKNQEKKFDYRTEQEWASHKLRSKRDKNARQEKSRKEYTDLVKRYGRNAAEAHYGALSSYIKKRLPKTATTLKSYKDQKKKQQLTKDIVMNIKV